MIKAVIKRTGNQVPFDTNKIIVAIQKAFKSSQLYTADTCRQQATDVAMKVLTVLNDAFDNDVVHIEKIQDVVEKQLMQSFPEVARLYIIYRHKHNEIREDIQFSIIDDQGNRQPFVKSKLKQTLLEVTSGLLEVDVELLFNEAVRNVYDGMSKQQILNALLLAIKGFQSYDTDYSYAAARLLLKKLRKEAEVIINTDYTVALKSSIDYGIKVGRLDPRLLEFDFEKLSRALIPERDHLFKYLGLQILYDRYFLQQDGIRYELPQTFFMRVAMGLALNESPDERTEWAILFYNVISKFDGMVATPTLFNSGTVHPQLSSCFVSTTPDDLKAIYRTISENALQQKWAGGIGNNFTNIRGMGAMIHGTNGLSSGIIPFIGVVNATLIACDQGGKRRGSGCVYLEPWHIDVTRFIELRKNTGDDRNRAHDTNTALWVPDLFMQRVASDSHWCLFSPDEVPGLHSSYGKEFEKLYTKYEEEGKAGKLRIFKRIRAKELWQQVLTMLYETGHPWITYKDAFNLRNQQKHCGVIHSSNLCTEIALNTKAFIDDEQELREGEIAVCNLSSVNLANHIIKDSNGNFVLDVDRLKNVTIPIMMRMLDNVIDLNFYPLQQNVNSNLKHRPVGLGCMGFQDALYKLKIPYASNEAIEFARSSMETISYYAIFSSSLLAVERGKYQSYEGSNWDLGKLPIDTVSDLAEARNTNIPVVSSLDWEALRQQIKQSGIRNSNCLAIAPTATIGNICGVTQSIEPMFQNIFVKKNLSGDFMVLNSYLVDALKEQNLWDIKMIDELQQNNGSVQGIQRIPKELRKLFATAFEVSMEYIIDCAAARQQWIDQSQSMNVYFIDESDGKRLSDLYFYAWKRGLKSTYYLRSKAATSIRTVSVCNADESCEFCAS